MSVRLITGYTGTEHVTSADDGNLHMGIFGNGSCVLNTGNRLAATMQSSNSVIVSSGDVILQGRHIVVTGNNELAISNGSQGMKRRDFIVMRYRKDAATGVESAELAVIEGTSGSAYSDPKYTAGNLYNGDLIAEFPIYRIDIDGLSAGAPVMLSEPVMSSTDHTEEFVSDLNKRKDEVRKVVIDGIGSTFVNKVAANVNATLVNAIASKANATLAKAIGNLMFPVGSRYLTVEYTNPSGRFGGTWVVDATRYLANAGHSDSVSYRTHVSSKGWEKVFVKDGKTSGTTGKALSLEAIQIKPTASRTYTKVYVWKRTA